MYTPEELPNGLQLDDFAAFLGRELHRISAEFMRAEFRLPILAVAPLRPQNGDIVYADGVSWNPGMGEGFYGYENGSWTKL